MRAAIPAAPIAAASDNGLSASEQEMMAFLQRAGVVCQAPVGVTSSLNAQPSAPASGGAANAGHLEDDTMALLTCAGFTADAPTHSDAEPVAKWHR